MNFGSLQHENITDEHQHNHVTSTSYSIFPGLGEDGERVILNDKDLTEDQLRSKGVKQLRFEMLCAYISCDNVTTMDALLKLRAEQYGTDKTHLPLYVQRTNKKKENPFSYRGRIGLVGCRNEGCMRCEDGFTAFKTCSGCKGPCYCSKECQRAAWSQHKHDCKRQRRQAKKEKKSMANMMDPLNEMMSIFANAPSIEMPDGSRMPLIPMDSM